MLLLAADIKSVNFLNIKNFDRGKTWIEKGLIQVRIIIV